MKKAADAPGHPPSTGERAFRAIPEDLR